MMICSLCAYVFLVQVQAEDKSNPTPLYQELSEQDEAVTSPDVGVFKHVVTVVTELLPAS